MSVNRLTKPSAMTVRLRRGRGVAAILSIGGVVTRYRLSGLAEHGAQGLGDMLQAQFGMHVIASHFGGDVSVIADGLQRLAHSLPRHVALQWVAEAGDVADAGVEVLDMHLLDALSQDFDPLVGIAVGQDIARVEVGSDVGAANLVKDSGELQRREQELVPDVL